jgi:hypothetical protein
MYDGFHIAIMLGSYVVKNCIRKFNDQWKVCYYGIQLIFVIIYLGIVGTDELRSDHHYGYNTIDDDTLATLVADRLDLPYSKNLLGKIFERSIIQSCWNDQLKLKRNNKQRLFWRYIFVYLDDDFANNRDLYMACVIRHKQNNLIRRNSKAVIIPSVALKDIYEKRQIPLSNQSYAGETGSV